MADDRFRLISPACTGTTATPLTGSGEYEFRAKIAGVESDGHLLLETENKEVLKFEFKEVNFV